MSEVIKAVEQVSGAFNELKSVNESRFSELRERLEKVESISDRPRTTGKAGNSAEHKALNDFVRTGRGLAVSDTKTMSMATAADGGGLVPELIAAEIIDRALSQGGLAKLVRRTRTPTSDYVRLLNLRGRSATWVAETTARGVTADLELREIRPPSGELYSAVTVTNFLMNDSQFDVAQLVVDNAAAQFARSLETAVYNGSGTAQPEGIMYNAPVATADDASPRRAANVIEKVVGGSDIGNNLISGYFALAPEHRRNATWVMSSATLSIVRQLRDSNGSGYLWQANLGQGMDASDGTLLGRPVVTCEDMGAITDGSPQVNGVLVGDFKSGYELIEIGPLQILRDPYSARGFTTFYIAARFGGKLVDNDAIKVIAT